nr:hypothetical protein [Candidatus Microthrix sp.]
MSTESLVIDNIGSLITNDPALGQGPLGIVEHASVVIDDDVVVEVAPPVRSPTAASTPRAPACCPALSTPTATWCSPGIEPRSSPPAWRASPTTAAASR